MTLSARVIALQGIGAGALAIALQGLLPVAQPIDQAQRGRTGDAGGVVSRASLSLSEWLEIVRRRAVVPGAPRATPAPPTVADVPSPAPRVRTAERRRREEEALFLLMTG